MTKNNKNNTNIDHLSSRFDDVVNQSEFDDLTDNLISKIAFERKEFTNIPPIIGTILANQNGTSLLVFEHRKESGSKFGPIKTFISTDDKNLMDIDLISMYFSSFKIFASQNNIKDLSFTEIHGSNLKTQIFFLDKNYMLIVFLNANTIMFSDVQAEILSYFKELLDRFKLELHHFNASASRKTLKRLGKEGSKWLMHLNKKYFKLFQTDYLKSHLNVNKITKIFEECLNEEITAFFPNVPEHIALDLLRETKNLIQDRIFSFFQNKKEGIQ